MLNKKEMCGIRIASKLRQFKLKAKPVLCETACILEEPAQR